MRACRTCLTKKDLNPLFGDLSAVRFTSKQLYLATGLQIRPNDDLPQLACKSCIKQIKKILNFRYISYKTNKFLQQILKNFKINREYSSDDDNFDRYFENTDGNKMFLDVKIEADYLQDSDIDNSQTDNKNTLSNNSHFNNQINYHINDQNQPDNEKKCLDNEGRDNNYPDVDRSYNSQSDNNAKSCKKLNNHNSQLDNNHTTDNKQYSEKKNTEGNVEIVEKHKTKRVTRKTSKNITKKNINRKLKVQDSCIHLSQKMKIKIKDSVTDSGNSDKSNNFSQKKAIKVKDVCEDNVNSDYGVKHLEVNEESKRNKVKIDRNICKQKRNKLMSLAITPYPSEGPVQCRVCHEHVKLTSFVMHAKRHFAPEFTCEECGKTFRSNAHMVYHQQRMHGKEKRLACSLCGFRTVDRLKLRNHERGHSGERPFVCNECGSSFRMRTNIVQHMRTHFGVRNVQCELCANLFRSRSELANHKNKVHNKMSYLCYLCPQTYKGKRAARRHLINIHGIKEDEILKIKCIKSTKLLV